MKKLIVSLSLIGFFGVAAGFSQSIDLGDKFGGVGIGPAISSNPQISPMVRLSFEKGMFEISPGVVSIGGVLGVYTYSEKQVATDYVMVNFFPVQRTMKYTRRYTNLVIGARSAWYYSFAQHGIRNVNAYAGLSLGLRTVLIGDHSTDTEVSTYSKPSNLFAPYFAGIVGVNYHFNANFAAFLEAGYDIAWSTIGIIYKFN